MSVTFISMRRFVANCLLVFACRRGRRSWQRSARGHRRRYDRRMQGRDAEGIHRNAQSTSHRSEGSAVGLVRSGREADLEQLQVAIGSPERRMRVVDFQPRTELGSELAGDVEVSNSNDSVQSLNASLGGAAGAPHVQASPGRA